MLIFLVDFHLLLSGIPSGPLQKVELQCLFNPKTAKGGASFQHSVLQTG